MAQVTVQIMYALHIELVSNIHRLLQNDIAMCFADMHTQCSPLE
jgi:hypothetical protein